MPSPCATARSGSTRSDAVFAGAGRAEGEAFGDNWSAHFAVNMPLESAPESVELAQTDAAMEVMMVPNGEAILV